MPSHAMYEIQPTTMSQLIGFMRASARERDLQPPQQQQRDHLHGHDLHERASEAPGQTFALRLVVCGRVSTSLTMRACSVACAWKYPSAGLARSGRPRYRTLSWLPVDARRRGETKVH